MINIKYVSLFSFVLFLFLDYLIINNYLGLAIKKYYLKFLSLSFIFKIIIIFSLAFLLLTIFSYFEVYLINFNDFSKLFETDLYDYMSNSDDKNKSGIHDNNINNTVNLNHPRLQVSVPAGPLNNLAGAFSSTSGAALAYKAAQNFPGSPTAKIGVATGIFLGVQAGSTGMGLIYNNLTSSNNNNNNNNSQKLIDLPNTTESANSLVTVPGTNNNLDTISNLTDKFNDFPLNLLPEINQLVTAELIFLFVILNVFIAQYITKIDYNKYIPDNKLGNILKVFINRYINI